jgi:hypothetical protein
LLLIGVILIVHYFAPGFWKIATLLIGSFIVVLALDLAFRLGVLYSFFGVSLGLLIPIFVLTSKKKMQKISADEVRRAMENRVNGDLRSVRTQVSRHAQVYH